MTPPRTQLEEMLKKNKKRLAREEKKERAERAAAEAAAAATPEDDRTATPSKKAAFKEKQGRQLCDTLERLRGVVFRAFSVKMLPLRYDKNAMYTIEQFNNEENEHLLFGFAEGLFDTNVVISEKGKGNAKSVKHQIVKELLEKGQLVRKGVAGEVEATIEAAVKPIIETIRLLDAILKEYGGSTDLLQRTYEVPGRLIGSNELLVFAEEVACGFGHALRGEGRAMSVVFEALEKAISRVVDFIETSTGKRLHIVRMDSSCV